jgi:hypothetical protein
LDRLPVDDLKELVNIAILLVEQVRIERRALDADIKGLFLDIITIAD